MRRIRMSFNLNSEHKNSYYVSKRFLAGLECRLNLTASNISHYLKEERYVGGTLFYTVLVLVFNLG